MNTHTSNSGSRLILGTLLIALVTLAVATHHASAGDRNGNWQLTAGTFYVPTVSYLGLGLSRKLSDNFEFGMAADFISFFTRCLILGGRLRYNLGSSLAWKPFISVGIDYSNCVGKPIIYYGAGTVGLEWTSQKGYSILGGVSGYQQFGGKSNFLPTIAVGKRF